ncbi:phospholipid scramblase 2-like [Brienomyrus brachyistius]|uniref:phospholipid scramblase 2-like n=1 Tax=Brienomyrus brachyistius TaxID=42636 RepID=UPI0020B3FF71|nr:phospholipid scramblase 2-like [Brienomyrus brachyistius]XP_048845400.1 phospholipid scramblase 2-like [Brienomyrus brachyistius]XP_048845401.1 phospholipid scramblase 2-like [Brienomyrus brachyistius]
MAQSESVFSPGLEYLTQIDELIVQGEVDYMEALSAFQYKNIYGVKNSLGQVVFYAVEDSDCCDRFCCGSQRSFLLRVMNNLGEEVIRISRPLNCCLQELEVQCPPGKPIGYVTQELHPFHPEFMIRNERDEPVLKLTGPFCICGCDTDFEVKSPNEAIVVGRITKHWAGLAQELFTNASNFAIRFPLDLDVRVKAVLLGACFLIDFMYYKN